MLIEAGNKREILASRLDETFPTAHGYFFKCFKAIGHKGGAHDEKLFDATLRKSFEFALGVGFQPRVATEPGLE